MLKTLALAFGVVSIILGVLGFVHGMTQTGELLDLFYLNGFHVVIYLATGAIGLCTGFTAASAAKNFFQVFGIVYALLGVFGLFYGDQDILGLVTSSEANTWLHLSMAVIALSAGFIPSAQKADAPSVE